MVVDQAITNNQENIHTHFKGKGGPHGLGDPNDTSLRKVESEILIPKKMRDRARTEKCVEETKNFIECCKSYSLGMVVMCRKENTNMQDCLGYWYNNAEFKDECTKEYLAERAEYRRTGLTMKQRKAQTTLSNT